jgi:hypothetical protein
MRTLGADPGNTLQVCSLCPCSFLFPQDGRYMGDGIFYCWRHEDTETSDQRTRREAAERASFMGHSDENAPLLPGGGISPLRR